MSLSLQKASLWKRISAWLFDLIMLAMAVVLFAWALSAAVGYNDHYALLQSRYEAVAQAHGFELEEVMNVDPAQLPEDRQAAYREAEAELNGDGEAIRAMDMIVQLSILIASLSIFMGYLLLEFVIPLLLHNGQTLGKKIFGVALMRPDFVKVGNRQVFIRAILGKYAVETMIPVTLALMLLVGQVSLVALGACAVLLFAQVLCLILTRPHTLLHDALAQTVCVDFASQMMFDSYEAMIAWKTKHHAEKVAQEAAFSIK